ncbi:Hypothetical protein NTJ_13092 [Nesidiocoris tenuis]|uniref:Uncharacterized protein n=1 Tax=Nesidiocoris tenuis TaxID=355587 RepID=A0ABN7B9H3_9HEMI|nr:Hypothetical protein NTJ_13092 [Nesidiocoris tenuis]
MLLGRSIDSDGDDEGPLDRRGGGGTDCAISVAQLKQTKGATRTDEFVAEKIAKKPSRYFEAVLVSICKVVPNLSCKLVRHGLFRICLIQGRPSKK